MSLEQNDISDEDFELFNRDLEDYIRCKTALEVGRENSNEEDIEKALEAMAKRKAESKF